MVESFKNCSATCTVIVLGPNGPVTLGPGETIELEMLANPPPREMMPCEPDQIVFIPSYEDCPTWLALLRTQVAELCAQHRCGIETIAPPAPISPAVLAMNKKWSNAALLVEDDSQ